MLARSTAAALAFAALSAGTARAQEDPYSRPALYGAAGGTFAYQFFDDAIGRTGQPATVNNSQGFELRLGYRGHPNVAGEFEIDILDGFNGEVGTQNTAIDVLATTFSLKGFLPLGRFHPYLSVGAGYASYDAGNEGLVDDGTGPVVRFGAGTDFYVTDNFAVYVGSHYLLPFGDNEDLDLVAIHFGIQYMLRFQDR